LDIKIKERKSAPAIPSSLEKSAVWSLVQLTASNNANKASGALIVTVKLKPPHPNTLYEKFKKYKELNRKSACSETNCAKVAEIPTQETEFGLGLKRAPAAFGSGYSAWQQCTYSTGTQLLTAFMMLQSCQLQNGKGKKKENDIMQLTNS
jgi:hypothetical protein